MKFRVGQFFLFFLFYFYFFLFNIFYTGVQVKHKVCSPLEKPVIF